MPLAIRTSLTRLFSTFVALTTIGLPYRANAQEVSTVVGASPDRPYVFVSAEGPDEAALEERIVGGDHEFRRLCFLPCTTKVLSAPHGEHRIVDGSTTKRILIRAQPGAHVTVRYARASETRTPLIVGGAVVGTVGAVLTTFGFIASIRTIGVCDAAADCSERDEARAASDKRNSSLLTIIGLGALGAGGAGVFVGAFALKSKATVSSPERTNDASARAATARATWTRPEMPKPPLHLSLFEMHF